MYRKKEERRSEGIYHTNSPATGVYREGERRNKEDLNEMGGGWTEQKGWTSVFK